MEISTLQAFVKVVQTGSFTRAADNLKTQKAHLSRQISQLEKELGVRLLERTTRALSLTEIGREFFEHALSILNALDEAQRVIQRSQGQPRGTLKLTCGVEFGMIAVNHWMNIYLNQYPEVRIDADFTSRVVDIVHEGFDLAIRVGSLPDSSLAARKLGDLSYGLFSTEQYLARQPLPLHPDDLHQHQILAFTGGRHQTNWTFSNQQESISINITPRFKANNTFAIRDAVMTGLGIAQLPLLVAQPALEQGQLRQILVDWTIPSVPVYAVFASVRYLTPKVRNFIDLAVEQMQTVKHSASTTL